MHISTTAVRRTTTALLCAGVLTVAACGSDSDSEADTSTGSSGSPAAADSTSNAQDSARVRLEECLREQGVKLPHGAGQAPGPPPADFDPDALQKALQGPCKDLAQGAFGDTTEASSQEFQDQLAEFRQCMSKQGVEVPDFQAGGSHGQFDTDDPDVQKATKACEDSAPTGGPFGPAAGE